MLEIPDDKGGNVDSTKGTWRQLLIEFLENGVSDPTVNCHSVICPVAGVGEESGASLLFAAH